jgi:hypothetical protein
MAHVAKIVIRVVTVMVLADRPVVENHVVMERAERLVMVNLVIIVPMETFVKKISI